MQAVRQRRTSQDNSRGMRRSSPAIRRAHGLRAVLLVAALAGAGALVAATLTTVIRIMGGRRGEGKVARAPGCPFATLLTFDRIIRLNVRRVPACVAR